MSHATKKDVAMSELRGAPDETEILFKALILMMTTDFFSVVRKTKLNSF